LHAFEFKVHITHILYIKVSLHLGCYSVGRVELSLEDCAVGSISHYHLKCIIAIHRREQQTSVKWLYLFSGFGGVQAIFGFSSRRTIGCHVYLAYLCKT